MPSDIEVPGILAEVASITALAGAGCLDALVANVGSARFVGIGEASHGTHEFCAWRAILSRRLISEHGFTWIGVEGDWPDCARINRWVRGQAEQHLDAHQLLDRFERWPTWMWANEEVAEFLDWLHGVNLGRPEADRVGFYGLDVYSLWDSLREIVAWLDEHAPDSVPAAREAVACFAPFGEDPHRYGWCTRIVPTSCEADVVALLAEVLRRSVALHEGREGAFDAAQNAEVAVGAERYYREMVRGDRESWNIRDHHMADTIDRIATHLGSSSKGLIWEHNTHIGDARATEMAQEGIVNVGQLLRERHRHDEVALVGFASHRGTVLAAAEWGAPERVLDVPAAQLGTHEDLLHRTLGVDAVLVFGGDRSGPWFSAWLGHRAIGVVYQPSREHGNYVRTRMGERYDALIWIENTEALHPLHRERHPRAAEYETEPSGF